VVAYTGPEVGGMGGVGGGGEEGVGPPSGHHVPLLHCSSHRTLETLHHDESSTSTSLQMGVLQLQYPSSRIVGGGVGPFAGHHVPPSQPKHLSSLSLHHGELSTPLQMGVVQLQ